MPVWLAMVVLASVSACGGVVETRDPNPDPSAGSPGAAGKTSAGGGNGIGGNGSLGGTVELPECKKGRLADTSTGMIPDCPYLHDSRCYDTKLDACACACAKLKDSTCSSGFPEPDGTTLVTCY